MRRKNKAAEAGRKKGSPEKERKVSGCMRCGSSDLNSTPGGAYAWNTQAGMSLAGFEYCNKCGFYGIPLIFKSDAMRQKYEKAKASR